MKQTISVFILLLSFSAQLFSQSIPNPGFENWLDGNPVDWSTYNPLSAAFGITTATQGTPAPEGNSYLSLQTHFSDAVQDFIPGMALAGNYDLTGLSNNAQGFPYNGSVPNYFNFMMRRHGGVAADTSFIAVAFTKWNTTTQSQDMIAIGTQAYDTETPNWTPTSISVTQLQNTTPDTCAIIIFSSFGVFITDGTYIHLDALAFSQTASASSINDDSSFRIYPNPATDNLNIDLTAFQTNGPSQIQILDSRGSVVYTETNYSTLKQVVSLDGFASGLYFVKVTTDKKTRISAFVKK